MSSLWARSQETRSELRPVWNLKPLWNVVPLTWQFHCGQPWNLKPFTWRFHCGNFPNHSKTLLHMCKWYLLINVNLIDAKQMLRYWLFLENRSKAHAHFLSTLMILRNFISLRVFTVYMENSLRFEISLRSIWPKWNSHRSEFRYARSHVNADNKVTSHRSEILPRSEISNQFEFTLGLM